MSHAVVVRMENSRIKVMISDGFDSGGGNDGDGDGNGDDGFAHGYVHVLTYPAASRMVAAILLRLAPR